MRRILLGADIAGGKPLQLDIARLLESRLLVQANSGAGKSWALRRLLEQTFGEVPQVVIDVEDEFHTLREKFPYVLAGAAGADCRADVRTAPLLARRVLEHGFSAIVSIYELKAHERMRFVRAFLEALVAAPRALWRPLLVVVDEAHMFCPEKGQAESAGAVIDLMTRGRKRGFCGVLATQRISKLHKDAAAEANNKLIGRSALDLDMRRSADELGFSGREEQHRLRTLAPGEFFAFGPALTPQVRLIRVGDVQTTHPQPGARGNVAPPPAPEKLKAILAKLADLPKDAEAEEGELERLRREVMGLRRENVKLKDDPGAVMDVAVQIGTAREQAREEGARDGYAAALRAVQPFAERLGTLGGAVRESIDAFQADLKRLTSHAPVRFSRTAADSRPAAPARPPAPRAAAVNAEARGDVSAPQQRILDALAWLESVGIDRAERVQVALLADQSPKSSGYGNNLGFLRTAGLIDYPATGTVQLTDAGRGAARAPARPPSTDDLHRTLEERLPAPQWAILRALSVRPA